MLNAAVIGLGWWGKHIIGCLDGSDCLKVVQAMDISSNEAGNFAASKDIEFTSDFEEVLKNPKNLQKIGLTGFYFIVDWPMGPKPFYVKVKKDDPKISESTGLNHSDKPQKPSSSLLPLTLLQPFLNTH